MTSLTLSSSMFAWQYSSTQGGLEKNLHFNRNAPIPPLPSKGSFSLIKVLSTSLNPQDYKVAEVSGLGKLIIPRPATPAVDFLGQICQSTVPGFEQGDLVCGTLGIPQKYGSLAEFIVVKGIDTIVKVPEAFLKISRDQNGNQLVQLACIGIAGVTALQSLKDVTSGAKIFINGGSGGTGTFGVQIAKHVMGCEVVTSCSSRNVALVKEIGADEVIDYTSQNVVEALKNNVKRTGKVFDFLVDFIGADMGLYWQSHHFLTQGGVYALVGTPTLDLGLMTGLMKVFLWPRFLGGGKRRFSMVGVRVNVVDLQKLVDWILEGQVKAVIDEQFSLQDAPKAFEKLKKGSARGKIVVDVSEPVKTSP